MLGTIVNTAAIVLGGGIGCLLRGGMSHSFGAALVQAMALPIILIGLMSAIETNSAIVVILCMAVGVAVGTLLRIDHGLSTLGQWVQRKLTGRSSGGEAGEGELTARGGVARTSFAEGFVYATLVYCVGAMAIVGSLESGLQGNHNTLFAKSLLDGVMSIVLASTMGPGVLLSAVPVLLYQGAITACASWVAPLLTEALVIEMSAVGGLLVVGIGLNLMKVVNIKIANMLPAVFMPIAIVPFWNWVTTLL